MTKIKTAIDTSTEAIEALLKDVTPGPWGRNTRAQVGPVSQEDDQSYGMICDSVCELDYSDHWEADSHFIAAARELVPALLAERDALKAENERLKDQADAVWNEAIEAAIKEVGLYSCSAGSDAFTEGVSCGYKDAIDQVAEGLAVLKRPVKGESHE
jgi:hypothetical protein